MTTSFQLKRVWQLLKIDIAFVLRYLLMSLSIPVIFAFFMSFNPNNNAYELYDVLISMMKAYIFLGGVIFTSYAFAEMYNRNESQHWFMLPASMFEKVIAKWLLTFMFYFLLITIGMMTILFITQFLFDEPAVGYLFLSSQNDFFSNAIWPSIQETFVSYLFYHAIFFLGAAFFTNWVVMKTFLVMILTGLVMAITAFLFQVRLELNFINSTGSSTLTFNQHGPLIESSLVWNLDSYLAFTLIPALWLATYFVIKRKQVSHAV